MSVSLYERLGAAKLRLIVADFYERMQKDVMIGYLFDGKSVARFVEKETEWAAALLGGPATYSGRGIREAHAGLGILGGHFARRSELLRQTLCDHGVDDEIQRAWLGHTESMRHLVTADGGTHCGESSS